MDIIVAMLLKKLNSLKKSFKMTNLEREYFNTFTLERLKAFYKAVSKEAHCGGTQDLITECLIYDGASYVTRKWMRPGRKVIEIKINKRKVRNAIKEREQLLEK